MEKLRPLPAEETTLADTTALPLDPAAHKASPQPERLGDYRILRVIGEGGIGVVYEAEHESLKNRVALRSRR